MDTAIATTTLAVIEIKSLHTGTEWWIVWISIGAAVISLLTLIFFGFILRSQIGATKAAQKSAAAAVRQSQVAIEQFAVSGAKLTVELEKWPEAVGNFKNIGHRDAKKAQVLIWVLFPNGDLAWGYGLSPTDIFADGGELTLPLRTAHWDDEEMIDQFHSGILDDWTFTLEVRYADEFGGQETWRRTYAHYIGRFDANAEFEWVLQSAKSHEPSEEMDWPPSDSGFDFPDYSSSPEQPADENEQEQN